MNYDKFYARSSYEALILQQSHIHFGGLWQVKDCFLVLCSSLDISLKTVDGKLLVDWFNYECASAICPIQLVQVLPEGAIRVPERTAEELALLHGEPLTISEVSREVSNTLSRQFPLLQISSLQGKLIIEVSRVLSDEEMAELDIALDNYKIDMGYELNVRADDVEEVGVAYEKFNSFVNSDCLALLPSRVLSRSIPSVVRDAYTEDEEFWVDHRTLLFSNNELGRDAVLPEAFKSKTSACFIDATVFVPNNIRTYLTVYHRIIVAMPLQGRLLTALKGFQLSKQDLLGLVLRGRVQFILPQPLHRYDADFLADVLSANSTSLLFSRKLSVASVIETRARVPFLYPTVGTQDRRQLLEMFASVNDLDSGFFAQAIGKKLGSIWLGMERNLSERGAMATVSHGIGPLLGALVTQITGRDLEFELVTSAMPVEWAAILHATYFPVEGEGYSSYLPANFCASMYSGLKNAPTVNPVADFQSFVSGLLSLNNDVSVLEVDSAFSSRDIDQFAKFLNSVSNLEEKREFIDKMNMKIKQFEKKSNRLNRLDFFSLGGAAAGVLAGNEYIAIGVWIMQYILSKADPSIDFGGRGLDWVRGANTGVSADVVLLSRVRKKLN